jgi:hypothetical protein
MSRTVRTTVMSTLIVLAAWLVAAGTATAMPPNDSTVAATVPADTTQNVEPTQHSSSLSPLLIALTVLVVVALVTAAVAHRKLRAGS